MATIRTARPECSGKPVSLERGRRRNLPAHVVVVAVLLFACDQPTALEPPAEGAAASLAVVLAVPGDYPTIQSALDAASAGAIIQVRRGTYHEQLLITTPGIHLHATEGVVLDGGGTGGIGIHILGAPDASLADVEVSGFEVTGYDRGIVVQRATEARIHRNHVHHNLDPVTPLVLGEAIGIDVVSSVRTHVSQNRVHDNGDSGIALRVGTRESLVQGNWISANGSQHLSMPDGRGILITGSGTIDNTIFANEVLGTQGRGILVGRPVGTAPITGNRIVQNRVHENQRGGISLMGPVTETSIEQNDARGNNLSGLPPCYQCNLIDLSIGGNHWRNNLGTFNLADPACLK